LGLIIVEVMPKPEILDPQGKAVRGAFLRHGVDVFTDVRQGKRFQLSVEGPVTEAHLESARELAATSHAKFLSIDHRFLLVGSANFSYSAEERNVELGLRLDDSALAHSVEKQLRDLEDVVYEQVRD